MFVEPSAVAAAVVAVQAVPKEISLEPTTSIPATIAVAIEEAMPNIKAQV